MLNMVSITRSHYSSGHGYHGANHQTIFVMVTMVVPITKSSHSSGYVYHGANHQVTIQFESWLPWWCQSPSHHTIMSCLPWCQSPGHYTVLVMVTMVPIIKSPHIFFQLLPWYQPPGHQTILVMVTMVVPITKSSHNSGYVYHGANHQVTIQF